VNTASAAPEGFPETSLRAVPSPKSHQWENSSSLESPAAFMPRHLYVPTPARKLKGGIGQDRRSEICGCRHGCPNVGIPSGMDFYATSRLGAIGEGPVPSLLKRTFSKRGAKTTRWLGQKELRSPVFVKRSSRKRDCSRAVDLLEKRDVGLSVQNPGWCNVCHHSPKNRPYSGQTLSNRCISVIAAA